MAKEKSATVPSETTKPAPVRDQIVVQHHSSHKQSPDQAEVLLGGKRVAYISYAPPHPINFLPPSYLGFTIPLATLEEIVAVAREKVAELAQGQADDQERIRKLLEGE
jgi:hypothetical protein